MKKNEIPQSGMVDMLNAVTREGNFPLDEFTKDNLPRLGDTILADTELFSRWFGFVINKIVKVIVNAKNFENPLKSLKKGTLPLGKGLEETYVNITSSQKYDLAKSQTELFKLTPADVQGVLHILKDEDKRVFKVSTSMENMRTAFASYEELNRLLNGIINSLSQSVENEEFVNTGLLVKTLYDRGQTFNVKTPSISYNETGAREFLAKILEYSDLLKSYSSTYNYAGVQSLSMPDRQVLLLSPKANAVLRTYVESGAYNLEKIRFEGRVIVANFLENTEINAMLLDIDTLQIWDALKMTTSIFNGNGLYMNTFIHIWRIYSASPFNTSIVFTDAESTVTGVTLPTTITKVKRNVLTPLTATVAGTGVFSQKCYYTISSDVELSYNTRVDNIGRLYVGQDVPVGTVIKLTVKSATDSTKTATMNLTVE